MNNTTTTAENQNSGLNEKRCTTCDQVEVTKLPPCPNQCRHPKCKSYPPKENVDYFGKLIIWLYGAPSVGKTTIIDQVCPKYNLRSIHVKQLLDQEVATGSVRAKCIANVMARGELVPNDIMIELLKAAAEKLIKQCDGLIIDGFPRDKRQGMLFEKTIAPVNVLIFLDCDKNEVTARHIERSANTDKRWPSDKRLDHCVAGRLALRIFYDNHEEIVRQYPHKMLRVQTLAKTPEQVFAEVCAIIDATITKNQAQVQKALAQRARIKDCFIRRPYYTDQ